jgi:cellulose synthase/poly-beta-1,6-N-acetylglucosamine synthase-like glycosyltransferase
MHNFIDTTILTYFAGLNTFYGMLILISIFEIARRYTRSLTSGEISSLDAEHLPPIEILIPAHNEEDVIADTVSQALKTNYPNTRVLVINDGSADETLDLLLERFDAQPVDDTPYRRLDTARVKQIYRSKRHPNLRIVDKVQGGKSDALNAGLNLAEAPLFATIDADTIVRSNAIMELVKPFIYNPGEVVATGGSVYLSNGAEIEEDGHVEARLRGSALLYFQLIEYIRGFIFGRIGLNRLGGNLIVSGAFGLFRRSQVLDIGGYLENTVGEDMELVVRLQKHARQNNGSGKVIQIPEPVCFTQAPENLSSLARQRARWQRGLLESLWAHWTMFMNPRYGSTGFLIFPAFVLFELLGPIVELFGYGWFAWLLVTDRINWWFAIGFIIVAFVWGLLISLQALLMSFWSNDVVQHTGTRLKLLAFATVENLGYRQMTLLFRLRGLLAAVFSRSKKVWGQPDRIRRQKKRQSNTE